MPGNERFGMDDGRGAQGSPRTRWLGRGSRMGGRARPADGLRAPIGPRAHCRRDPRLRETSLGMSVVYDAGLLVAADRNDREVWADHRSRLEVGVVPVTTAPVVAQVSRSPRQVQLRRFLRGCDIVGLNREESHEVGALLSRADTDDVVDAHVVLTAGRRRSTILTSDEQDLQRLSDCLPEPIVLRSIGPRRRRRRT